MTQLVLYIFPFILVPLTCLRVPPSRVEHHYSIQWVSGSLFWEYSGRNVALTTHPHLALELCLYSPSGRSCSYDSLRTASEQFVSRQ
jgi:hypothetical protein